MFKITRGTGFHLKFENGWTASVQFGEGNYCDNRFNMGDCTESANAEIAAWDKDGNWYNFENGDEVKGFVTANEVAEFIALISQKGN